jgi:hypothetical protein
LHTFKCNGSQLPAPLLFDALKRSAETICTLELSMGFCQLTLNKLVTFIKSCKCEDLTLGFSILPWLSGLYHLDLTDLAAALAHRRFDRLSLYFDLLSWYDVGEFLLQPYVLITHCTFKPQSWSVEDVDRFFDKCSMNRYIEDLTLEYGSDEVIDKELIQAIARGLPRCPSVEEFCLYGNYDLIENERFTNILERMIRCRGLLAACIPATLVHKRKKPWLPVELLKRVHDCIYRGL